MPDAIPYPASIERYDDYTFTVKNPLSETVNIPIVFNQRPVRTVTGISMQLVDGATGQPTGIPIQISKNWHKVASAPVKHDTNGGQWLRGSTMLMLEPGATRELRVRVAYGFWDGAGAASHAALSLIGFRTNGDNWKWEQSAIGAWGETTTYSPTQNLGGAFINDVRLTWTKPTSSQTSYGWTENAGGGDFLLYFDNDDNYH